MNLFTNIFIAFYQLLTVFASLGAVLFLGRLSFVSIKTKRPGMDGIDTLVHTVFLGLFLLSAIVLIKCGIADPLRAMFL